MGAIEVFIGSGREVRAVVTAEDRRKLREYLDLVDWIEDGLQPGAQAPQPTVIAESAPDVPTDADSRSLFGGLPAVGERVVDLAVQAVKSLPDPRAPHHPRTILRQMMERGWRPSGDRKAWELMNQLRSTFSRHPAWWERLPDSNYRYIGP